MLKHPTHRTLQSLKTPTTTIRTLLPTLTHNPIINRPFSTTPTMALLHHMPHSDFGSLFRLLDDYDAHRSGNTNTSLANTSPSGAGAMATATFSPRFDVREAKDAYMLDGELPGIEQKDINIEFTDPHTLVINGKTERSYSVGTPPGKRIGGAGGKQATVEDEEEEGKGKKGAGGKGAGKGAAGGDESEGGGKYWVSERSVGEFQRSFNFPTRVDQDGVKASLKHGVLSVKVPKVTAPQTKKIRVE